MLSAADQLSRKQDTNRALSQAAQDSMRTGQKAVPDLKLQVSLSVSLVGS